MAEQMNEQISKALGRIPSGCAVVTARAGDKRTGLLASWLQQASFEPPMITIAVKKGRPIEKLIDESGAVAVNLLGTDGQALMRHFGQGFSPEQDAFAGIGHTVLADGVAIEGRIALLHGRVQGKHDAGDHRIYVIALSSAEIGEIKDPYVHVRKNGLTY